MSSHIVSTKSELENARNVGAPEIIITGKLANDLHKAKKVAYVGAGTLALFMAALAVAPFTGGISMLGAASIAGLTGLEIAAIIAATTIGLALIIAVYKDYEEIECSNEKLVLRKKRS